MVERLEGGGEKMLLRLLSALRVAIRALMLEESRSSCFIG